MPAPALFVIDNVRLLEPGVKAVPGSLLIREGRISRGGPRPTAATPRWNGGGRLLTPGLTDIHTHGIGRRGYDSGADAIIGGAHDLPRFGVTSFLPTLVPRPDKACLANLQEISSAIAKVRGASVPGLHLEGPFMALAGAGCATRPGDLGLLEELLSAADHRVSAMSISPETPRIIPVIERLREHGICVFITHTRATVEQTVAAIDAGATHATHFYDVFPALPESDPGVRPAGVVETVLADPRVTVDFIADGVHVHPMAIRAALAAKGFEKVLLITDANIGAGLRPGTYDTPLGYAVRVREGDGARHAEKGFLAGSALTMDAGIRNLKKWLKLPEEQVWAMGTANPARLLGLKNKGHLKAGMDADLVAWDEDGRACRTWVKGECVYERV